MDAQPAPHQPSAAQASVTHLSYCEGWTDRKNNCRKLMFMRRAENVFLMRFDANIFSYVIYMICGF